MRRNAPEVSGNRSLREQNRISSSQSGTVVNRDQAFIALVNEDLKERGNPSWTGTAESGKARGNDGNNISCGRRFLENEAKGAKIEKSAQVARGKGILRDDKRFLKTGGVHACLLSVAGKWIGLPQRNP